MERIQVSFYTIPQAACGDNQMSWGDVAAMLKSHLERHFPGELHFSHVEFMSPEWFDDQAAQALLESQAVNLPFVLVDGEVACAEPKVNISKVRKHILAIKTAS